jgi:type IV pilus biogenesis protein PilP
LVALALAAVFTIASLVRAISISPVEAAEHLANAELARITTTAPIPEIDLEAIGANGIFQPDRTALPYRYRMPGETAPNDAGAPAPLFPAVLGTVLASDGDHFASVQLPGGRPSTVRVGDRIGEYTVTAIDRGKVTFKNAAGKSVEITATRQGARP